MEKESGKYTSELEELGQEALAATERLRQSVQEIYAEIPDTENLEDFENMAEELKETAGKFAKAGTEIFMVSDELSTRCRDTRQQRRKRKLIAAAPANGTIDLEEREGDHFARGLGPYKLLLILFIGSFAGVVVELMWCLIRNGYLESRSGLVYGPFNLLYGAGAVALTVCLYRFRNRSGWISFLGGMLVGTVVEYLCSWGQELLFGSRSWDYSAMPFNLNGRVCLLYSVFWGVLGVFWIKDLYPRMAQWILKIPNKIGKILTVAATVFLIFNGIVSLLAVNRWSERVTGETPGNSLEVLLDERFPDERMESVYANMNF